ncbi:family 1 glycosylhydrolase [Vibrio maritimus]|uniref:family 1 glycosylhydrolase n=1 Tax=Vibrio maritimus TaxID=990268 RepID=UPI0040692836
MGEIIAANQVEGTLNQDGKGLSILDILPNDILSPHQTLDERINCRTLVIDLRKRYPEYVQVINEVRG